MDSGSTVPTLKPGFNETAAVKLFTVAIGRSGPRFNLAVSTFAATTAAGTAGAMLFESARFFAADNAGNNNAARTEIMNTTTSSSISVNACFGILINTSRVFA